MADILVKCPKCGLEMSVSEYVDRSRLACPKCGKLLSGGDSAAVPQAARETEPQSAEVAENRPDGRSQPQERPAAEALPPEPTPVDLSRKYHFKKVAVSTGTAPENLEVLGKATRTLIKDRVSIVLGPDRWKVLQPLVPWVTFVVLVFIIGLVVRLRYDAVAKWMLGVPF